MQTLHKYIFFSFSCLLFLSLCSIMMVFTGASSTEVSTILQLEKMLLLPSLVYCVSVVILYLSKPLGLRTLWRRTPGFLIFTLCLINSLTISGFLAFYLVKTHSGLAAQPFELIPLWVGIASSIGLLLSFSFIQRNGPFSSYANRLKARQDIFTQKN